MNSVVSGVGNTNASTGNSKVVATLRADGNVYPTEAPFNRQLSNLLHYEIRTEGEHLLKSAKVLGSTTVVDLGKQLLQHARDSDVAGVKATLAHGAPFSSDWLGMSALHFAAMNNQREICEILLQGGINMDAKTKADRTPLHLACYYGHDGIAELLLSLKCAVNPRDMLRMTPLHWAVEKKHKAIVSMLLKHHADVTLTSKFGKTPIGLAVITEQADILAELESARQMQMNRVLNEESQKETSDAVNSIMDDSEGTNLLDETNMTVEDKMDVLENLKQHSHVLSQSALNMLRSHGIDMMLDKDDDASKEMLNTALQNGRQLVLSEGGRMLLHETQSNLTNPNKSFIYNTNNKKTVSLRHGSNQSLPYSSPQRIRMNVIKQKDSPNPGTLNKSKNIRIISLTDFKKLCGTDNHPKPSQKIPQSSSEKAQLSDGSKIVNLRQVQSRQLKLPTLRRSMDTVNVDDKQDLSEAITTVQNPATSSKGQVGTVQTIQLRPVPLTASASANNSTGSKSGSFRSTLRTANELTPSKTPNVMPLLSSSEICRQMYELRRHNEELRRRIDMVQREKDDMQHRIERLEQLILVQDSDDQVNYVNTL